MARYLAGEMKMKEEIAFRENLEKDGEIKYRTEIKWKRTGNI